MSEEERILRLPDVLYRTGLSRTTLYRKIAEGTFPQQVRISQKGSGWRASAVETWMENPVAYRS